jgi:hypothetical protein
VATAWQKRKGSREETLEKKAAEKKSAVSKFGLNSSNKEGWQRLQKQSQKVEEERQNSSAGSTVAAEQRQQHKGRGGEVAERR